MQRAFDDVVDHDPFGELRIAVGAAVHRSVERAVDAIDRDLPIMELDTLETFQMMIMRGLGVGILPLSSIRKRFRNDFYTVPFGSPALQWRLSLLQRRTHPRQVFLDMLFDALKRVADD